MVQHLALARSEQSQLAEYVLLVLDRVGSFSLERKGGVDRGFQLMLVKRLLDEVHGVRAEGGAGGRHVTMSGNDDERQGAVALAHPLLQLDATESGQPQIGDHAPAPRVIEGNQETFCIGEHAGRVSRQAEHQRQ
jgi:hypothetical protein